MKTPVQLRSARGFSLLEVLVAIVILSVGLLALAALQLALIRASNDTKAQTTAMSLAKEKIETLASYTTMGGSITCYSPASTPVSGQSSCYRMITSQSSPGESISGIGGVNYTRTTSVGRYIWKTASSAFVSEATGGFTNIMLDSGVKAACATCLTGKEFKRVLVTVSWTDAQGTTRSVQAEDAIPGLSPSDSLAVNSTGSFGAPRQAIAIIPNQATVQGVIPIAIGNGSDTAATNPRPVIVGQGNQGQTVETRFDVYTYAAIAGGNTAAAQSRVETAVVGCKCTLGTGTQTAFRPTYWNGFKYVVPTSLAGIPVSTAANVTQSSLCTACCRDHHDPDAVAGAKYDPRRTDHEHFLHTDLVNNVDTGGSAYDEACRLIRVDGIFRVAAEPYSDHYGLLATLSVVNHTATTCVDPAKCTSAESANAFPGTGTGSVTAAYQTFVLNYLKARFVTATAYNTVTDPSTVTGYSALQTPDTATIQSTTSPQYLHTRGLYIDYLNTEAIAAIASAKAACLAASCTTAQTQTAVLKLLAFTSINTTEVAGPGWTATNAKIGVTNLNDLSAAINLGLPAAGKAEFLSGVTGDLVSASTQMQRSSAGLAVLSPLGGNASEIVFPSDQLANNIMSDTQPYSITGPVVQGSESFTAEVEGDAFRATAQINNPWTMYFGGYSANNTGSPANRACDISQPGVRPYTCKTLGGTSPPNFALGGSTYLVFSNYNRNFTSGTSAVVVGNGCTGGTTKLPYIRNYDVNSVSPTPATNVVTNPNAANEYTTIRYDVLTANSTVTFTMASAPTYLCPTNWSTYILPNGNAVSPFSASCSNGQPASRIPLWATTYGACPSNVTFPP